MTYFFILSFVLLLVANSSANSSKNESESNHNRVRRLSDGFRNEETLQLARYMVSIRTRFVNNYYGSSHFCGGVIIAPQYVLTSAHCLVSKNTRVHHSPHNLLVVAGTPDRFRYQSGISFHAVVDEIFLPDNFTLRNEQDIAVLLLHLPIPRNNKRIRIARLPIRPVEVGSMCSVMGWGRMYRSGPISAKIVHINIKVISSAKCAELLDIRKVDLLCALDTSENTAQTPCSGDRGSPLLQDGIIYGIVSYPAKCQSYHRPSVYTDVFQSVEWIRSVIMDKGSGCQASLLLFCGAAALNLLLT